MRQQGITEDSLRDLVGRFYAKVRADPLIGPVFNAAIDDWPDHLTRLQAFWSSVMLTSGRYKGRPLPAHVRHADAIDEHSFARWLAIWKDATEETLDPDGARAMQEKAALIAGRLSEAVRMSCRPQPLSGPQGASSAAPGAIPAGGDRPFGETRCATSF